MTSSRRRVSRVGKKTVQTSERVFTQFCQNSSIHGVKYIVDGESTILERLAWILVFFAGIAFSTYFCYQMWRRFDESPTLMSLDTTRYPLVNIPFPAVSICNVNKASRRRLEKELSEDPRFDNVTYEVMQRTLRYMTKLDRAIQREEDLAELSAFYKELNVSPMDLFNLLKKTAPTCRDMVMDCSWQGLTQSCFDYLDLLPTDDGLCCVFNGALYSDPDLDIFSSANELLNVSGNGYRQGLSLVLDAQVEDYAVTNGKFDGFKVLVHASQKFPDVADRGFVIGPGKESFVGVKGITADMAEEVVSKVSLHKRNCRSEQESTVQYFRKYSQSGCIIECAARLIKENFKCRPYFLRAEVGTPLCDMALYSNISRVYESVRQHPDLYQCDCLPPCTDEWFEPEISDTRFPGHGFNLSRTFRRLAAKQNLSGEDIHENPYFKANVAILHVYYKDRTGIRYKMDIRYGIEDFISAMGGLLGLGLGISFISFIELGYFLFLRCFCHSRYAGSKDDVESIPNGISLSFRVNSNRIRHPEDSTPQPSSHSSVANLTDSHVGPKRY